MNILGFRCLFYVRPVVNVIEIAMLFIGVGDTFAFGLSALIHFGGQQAFSALHRAAISTSMMLEFLKELGVDTDKEFMINDTVCEVRNERIGEVGNKVGVPSSIHQKAVERYEELLYIPLSER